MPLEHYRPNGDLVFGNYCQWCGKATGTKGHGIDDVKFGRCVRNPDLVRAVRDANKPKPHFKQGKRI